MTDNEPDAPQALDLRVERTDEQHVVRLSWRVGESEDRDIVICDQEQAFSLAASLERPDETPLGFAIVHPTDATARTRREGDVVRLSLFGDFGQVDALLTAGAVATLAADLRRLAFEVKNHRKP